MKNLIRNAGIATQSSACIAVVSADRAATDRDFTEWSAIPNGQAVRRLVERILPKGGILRPHQTSFFENLRDHPDAVPVLTSGTGSGKSLNLWAWMVAQLPGNARSDGTGLACFPTKSLLYDQACTLAEASTSVEKYKKWTKIERDELRKMFDRKAADGFIKEGIPVAGVIGQGPQAIPWSIWTGVDDGNDGLMTWLTRGAGRKRFEAARLRLGTIDVANCNIITACKFNDDFLLTLRAVALDEAHQYTGVFGANVHYFLERMDIARAIMLSPQEPDPTRYLLASATLDDPARFAKALLPRRCADSRVCTTDGSSDAPLIQVMRLKDAISTKYSTPTKLLFPFHNDDGPSEDHDSPCLAYLRQLGPQDPNAIYFVNSKQRGSGVCRALLHDADGDVPQAKHVAASGRIVVQYDASCPAEQRRFIEWLLGNTGQGVSVIATSAMEVGVDFDHLDICCMDELPLTSKELLQRIGRVGRTAGRPGIVIFNADSVLGSDIEDNPKRALRYDPGTPVIPTDLELIRFKHLCALSFELHDRKSSAYDAVVERFVQPVFHVGNLRFMETIAPRASELGIPRGLASESRLDHGSWFRGSLRSAAREVRVFAGWAAIGREDAGIALRRVPPGGLYHRQGETYCVPAWLDGVVRPGELTQLDRIDVVRSKVQGRSQVRIDTAVKFTDDSGGILAGRRWISGSAQVTQLLRTIVNQFEDGRSERVKLPDAPCGYTYETRGLRLPVDIACEQPLPRYGLESLLECFVAHGLGVSPNDLVVRLVTTNARAANISHINEIQLLDGGISANGVTHHAGRHPACLVKGLELCVKSLAGSDRVRRATLALVDPFTAIQHGSGIDQAVIATCKAMLDACAQAVRR